MCLLRRFCCFGKSFQNFFEMNFRKTEFLTPKMLGLYLLIATNGL